MKKILRISIPGFSATASLQQYLDTELTDSLGWKVYLNGGPKEADAWFIIEDVPVDNPEIVVAPANIFYGTAETARPVGYLSESSHMGNFLKQFSRIYSHLDLYQENVEMGLPFLPWMINSNHGDSIFSNHPRDFQFLRKDRQLEKVTDPYISVFCSNQQMTPGHRLRIRFTREIKKYFGEKIVWFGNGVNTLKEKWDGLAPFKYSIVLENHSAHYVITEKLIDPIITKTYPLYWGAPNVGDYFELNGIRKLNIMDLRASKDVIAEIIERDPYADDVIQKGMAYNRNLVLHRYNFLNRILEIAQNRSNLTARKQLVQVLPKNSFLTGREKIGNQAVRLGMSLLKLLK